MRNQTSFSIFTKWLAIVVLSSSLAQRFAAAAPLRVAEGFAIEKVAGAPQIRFPMFASFDDQGRFYVAESSGLDLYDELQKLTRKCRVSVLEDRDGDGRYEEAQIFADGLVFPMGLAWRDGKLYVADPPQLVAFEDTNEDNRADRRTVILDGFGHRDNGSLHGLIFGPDGWLYMTMGAPDGYNLKRADGSVLSGKSGALLRCRPNGTGIEVVGRGFENLVEVAFTSAGDIIGTDNWFALPSDGIRDALVHLVEGGLYPLNLKDHGTAHLISGEGLPAISLYPAVAHSGISKYRGTAFPERFRKSFFSAQHNTRKVVGHHIERLGATFQSTEEDLLWTEDPDFHPSDVLEDADGTLLVLDTGSWYVQHCPTGRIRQAPSQGGIYRVRFKSASFVRDPRGGKLNWTGPGTEQLAERLSDSRAAVRDRAKQQLIKHGEKSVEALGSVLRNGQTDEAKAHAIWALAQIEEETAREPIRQALQHTNEEVVIVAARALARYPVQHAETNLVPLLRHPTLHVRLAGAESLAHCGSARAVTPILDALQADPDRFLEHSLIYALHRLAGEKDLAAALSHSHPRVQKAGLVLLDQAPHQKLTAEAAVKRLVVPDEGLRRAAQASVIKHPEWAVQVVPVVRALMLKLNLTELDKAMLKEFVATFRGQRQMTELIAEAIGSADFASSDEVRVVLLEAVAGTKPDELRSMLTTALGAALERSSALVKLQAIRTAHSLQLTAFDQQLSKLANDVAQPVAVRMEALRTLVRRKPALTPAELALLRQQLHSKETTSWRLASAEILGAAKLTSSQLQQFIAAAEKDMLISPGLVLRAAQAGQLDNESRAGLLQYLQESLRSGWQLSGEQLEWVQATVPETDRNGFAAVLRELQPNLEQQRKALRNLEPLLRGGDENLGHAVFLGKAGCVACHRVGRQGGIVGPDLTRIGATRAGLDLIESLVMPSATFAQGYETYEVITQNGDAFTGVRARSFDDSTVLRDASGGEVRFHKDQIRTIERLKASVMPEGLLSVLSQNEIRNLLAYLQNLK